MAKKTFAQYFDESIGKVDADVFAREVTRQNLLSPELMDRLKKADPNDMGAALAWAKDAGVAMSSRYLIHVNWIKKSFAAFKNN